jgi:hypothetical protein
MKVVDIANEIFIDAGSPTTTSIPAIAFWVRGQVGRINNLLYEDFTINETTLELTHADGTEISYEAVAVIKQLYRLYDYEVQIRTQMNALAACNILSIDDQGTSITRINRNSVSQTLSQIRRDEISMLNDLITAYRNNNPAAMPSQVAGDDTYAGPMWDYPEGYIRSN